MTELTRPFGVGPFALPLDAPHRIQYVFRYEKTEQGWDTIIGCDGVQCCRIAGRLAVEQVIDVMTACETAWRIGSTDAAVIAKTDPKNEILEVWAKKAADMEPEPPFDPAEAKR